MDKDHGEMPESLMKSDSYIVLCRNSEGFHLFVNGRTDVLADLAGSLFNEHPELFQLMMERHQPKSAERVNMIMSFLKGVADGAIDGSTAADFLSSFAGGDGDIELAEAIEEFKCAMLDRDDLPPEAPEARHTMDEMNDFLAEIGRSVKKGGGGNDRG